MAQVDTHLGWMAEGDWLRYAENTLLAELGGLSTSLDSNQPLPKIADANAVFAQGYHVATRNAAAWAIWDFYVAAGADTEGVVCLNTDNTSGDYVGLFTPTREFTFYLGVLLNGEQNSVSTVTPTTYTPHYNQYGTIGTTPIYYSAGYLPAIGASDIINIPAVGLAAMFNSLSVDTIQVTKDTDGYAVAAIAKWKTGAGAVITTPVLISTESEYTDMTASGGSYNPAKLNILHLGRRFYMSFFDITDGPNISSTLPVFDMTGEDDPTLTLENVFKFIASADYAHITVQTAPDPYEEEGAGSGEEGGDGEDLEDDEMGISHHAIPAAINTGFCRIYCPSASQLRDLSNYLWSAQYDIEAVKKLFANPMDSILGLSAIPLTLSGADMPVSLGGVSTGISLPMVSYQSYQVPMGAITVEKRWGSYLDYDPYTKFSIYLPFIGFKDLSADDIMGKQIILDYDVDILSGACTARLQAGGNVLYQWSGQCSIQLPVTASNWNQVFQNATSAALSAGLAVATGSAGPVLAGALAAEGAQAIMGKPRIERGGTASGAAGWMGGLTPYLVRVTPEAIIPNDQNKFIGYPAFSSISLGALTGYNEISSIHLEGIPATGAELEELEAILKGGVIF